MFRPPVCCRFSGDSDSPLHLIHSFSVASLVMRALLICIFATIPVFEYLKIANLISLTIKNGQNLKKISP
jgi:hypothetical protein